jgi:hypothetical protein
MSSLSYVKHEKLWLKDHPNFTERWLQERTAEDPAILGLGELILQDKEQPHPRAGRLDLLLQDPETGRRYEVEIQLGSTDEAHILITVRVVLLSAYHRGRRGRGPQEVSRVCRRRLPAAPDT